MWTQIMDYVWEEVTISIIGAFIVAIIGFTYLERRLKLRGHELTGASAMLEQHAETLDRLLAFEDMGDDLRVFLLEAERMMSTRAAVPELIQALFQDGENIEASPRVVALTEQVRQLEKKHPGFSMELKSFLDTGVYAGTLRWPETRGDYIRVTVTVEREGPTSMAALFARMIEKLRPNSLDTPPAPAIRRVVMPERQRMGA